jgi:hypothetical protein
LLRDENGFPRHKYYCFFFPDTKSIIKVSVEHPVFQKSPKFWLTPENSSERVLVKISVKAMDKDKKKFEEDDFFEIEEVKKEIPNQNSGSGSDYF